MRHPDSVVIHRTYTQIAYGTIRKFRMVKKGKNNEMTNCHFALERIRKFRSSCRTFRSPTSI